MKAMLLTAGLGTRLRPVTHHYAKPAVPFLNVPLLYYPVALLEQAGVDFLVLNSHHKPEQIEGLAAKIPGFKGRTVVSHEPGAPLGSGGGIWQARPHLDGGDFLLANGDEVILPKDPTILRRLFQEHARYRSLATILVMRHPLVGTQFGGVWADGEGRVRGFGKDGRVFGADATGYHYIGLVLMSDRVFHFLPDGESNILYDALTKGIQTGESVRVVVGEFGWFETGNERDFLEATRECLELFVRAETTGAGDIGASSPGRANEITFLHQLIHRFAEGSALAAASDPRLRDVEISGDSMIFLSRGCAVESGAKLQGFVVLGEGCVVENGATVQDSVLLPGATVSAGETVMSRIWFTP